MKIIDEKSFDFLTGREFDFMESVMRDLAQTPWAKQLLDDIKASGGLTGANKPKLFELRFGYALHPAGVTPRYGVPGEGQSTLDFGFTSDDCELEKMRCKPDAGAVCDGACVAWPSQKPAQEATAEAPKTSARRERPEGQRETRMEYTRAAEKLPSSSAPGRPPFASRRNPAHGPGSAFAWSRP